MDNEEDFVEISKDENDGESKEGILESEEAKETEDLLSSVSSSKASFSENILSSIEPSNLFSVPKSSFKVLEEFVNEKNSFSE